MSVALCRVWGRSELLGIVIAEERLRFDQIPVAREGIDRVSIEWFPDREAAMSARDDAEAREPVRLGIRTAHTQEQAVPALASPARKLLSVAEAADVTHRHAETLLVALRRGDLHGYQKMKRSPWVIQEECAVAWRLGQMCEHQIAEGGVEGPASARTRRRRMLPSK